MATNQIGIVVAIESSYYGLNPKLAVKVQLIFETVR